jgi:hypothetical protein
MTLEELDNFSQKIETIPFLPSQGEVKKRLKEISFICFLFEGKVLAEVDFFHWKCVKFKEKPFRKQKSKKKASESYYKR